MKKLSILALAIIGIYACNEAVKTGKEDNGKEFKPYNAFCSNQDSNLCPLLPYDVAENFGLGYQSKLDSMFQPPFDAFSWQTFVALNWPADANGNPTGNSIADNPGAKRVWEYYLDPAKTFTGGLLMAGELKLQMAAAESSGEKLLYMDAKSHRDLQQIAANPDEFLMADAKPLIDRNLNFTLYEIRINNVEDSFIRNNKLTTPEGIYKYAAEGKQGKQLFMPQSDSLAQNPGTIEIKTSWRILDPSKGDDTTRFYCRKATIYIDAAHTTNKQKLVVPGVTVGLVGMHIIRNTPKMSNQLIWSTFEHVDNAPEDAERGNDTRWSYYNKGCKDCPVNTPPPFQPGDNKQFLWSPTPPYAAHYKDSMMGYGNQVVREDAIYQYTDVLNKWWRAKLGGTVWANYKLVGTQWQRGEGLSGTQAAPVLLANTTLETYMQSTSSCIGCHTKARVIYNQDTVYTAFSFLFPMYKH